MSNLGICASPICALCTNDDDDQLMRKNELIFVKKLKFHSNETYHVLHPDVVCIRVIHEVRKTNNILTTQCPAS